MVAFLQLSQDCWICCRHLNPIEEVGPQASAYQATVPTAHLLSGLGEQDLVLLVLKPSRASLTFSLPTFLFQD